MCESCKYNYKLHERLEAEGITGCKNSKANKDFPESPFSFLVNVKTNCPYFQEHKYEDSNKK